MAPMPLYLPLVRPAPPAPYSAHLFLPMVRLARLPAIILIAATLWLAGCMRQQAAGPRPAPDVEVAVVEVRDVPVVKEWIATLDGRVNAEIRAQVTGYILSQNYQEGSFVRKGQLLFQIDPRPFQAALNLANGNLAQAEGNLRLARANLAQNEARLGKADLDVKRYGPLANTKAISQEEMDNAVQGQLEARAAVESTRAAIEASQAGVVAA